MANKQLNNAKHVGLTVGVDGDDIVLTATPASVGAAPTSHTHAQSDVTGLTAALNLKQDAASAFNGVYSSLSGIPSTFAPSAHTHSTSDIQSGTLPVSRGGTGATTFSSGELLVGNGTSAVGTVSISSLLNGANVEYRSITVNAQSNNYTLVATDISKLINCTSGSARQVTVPTNASAAIPVGSQILVVQTGSGTVTVKGATGVTVNGVSAGGAAISDRYQLVGLLKIATNEWLLSGPIGTVS